MNYVEEGEEDQEYLIIIDVIDVPHIDVIQPVVDQLVMHVIQAVVIHPVINNP